MNNYKLLNGKRVEMTDAEQAARDLEEVEGLKVSASQVTTERDLRLYAGFSFAGKSYGSTNADMKRITGAATLAGFAMGAGAAAGDLRWANAAQDFAWIAADNTLTTMDAQTCLAFGQAAAAHESAHIFAARALKDADPIPADFADDGYWP
jgi:hypothetical protein